MSYADGANVEKWLFVDYDFDSYAGGVDPLINRVEENDEYYGQNTGEWYPHGGIIWRGGNFYVTAGDQHVIAPNDPSVFSTGENGAPFPYRAVFYGPSTGAGVYYTFDGFDFVDGDENSKLFDPFWIGSNTNDYGFNSVPMSTSHPNYHNGDFPFIIFYGSPDNSGKRYPSAVYQRISDDITPVMHNDGELRTVIGAINSSYEGVTTPIPTYGVAPDPVYASINGRVRFYPAIFGSYELPAVEPARPKLQYEVVNAQTYRTEDFWDYADWFAEGFDANNPPVVVYANSAERNKHENPNPTNLFVKILDNGNGFWTWNFYNEGRWNVVAQQQGTIELSEKFFNNSTLYGWNEEAEDYDFDGTKVHGRDGSFELRVMADAILDNTIITDLEQNELWFSMVNFVHSCHDQVDWAFKTSFMTLVGFNEALYDEPVVKPDNTNFILSYVEEVKPYHVTVRDFARSYAPKNEDVNVTVTDFDKPGYYDAANFTYRRLNENLASDREIMAGGVWQHWLENMDLARKIKATMKLDRVWWQTGEPVTGAAERIMAFYQPDSTMKPKDLDLLLKLDFKGTVLDGMTFDDIDATAKITQGGTVSDLVDINGDIGDSKGFQMRDPRVAEDTPEDMVRLGAHDVVLFSAHDKWGAGAPSQIVKTYDTSRLTEARLAFQIGLNPVARTVLVFLDGQRQVENSNYAVDYLANSVFLPLQREDGTRVNKVTTHAFGYAAHTTIIDQQYLTPSSDNDYTEVAIPQSVLDYAYSGENETPGSGGSGETPITNPWSYTDIWKYTVLSQDTEDYSAVNFDDSLWNSGPGGFGSHFDGGNYQVGTNIPSTNTGQTIWLRKSFDAVDPVAVGDLAVQFWKDDYATLYWNGEIIPQFNISTYSAQATIPVSKILVGKNTLALKVVNGPAANIFAALEITAPNKVEPGTPGSGGSIGFDPGDYYVEVTNNGRYIASSLITTSEGVKKVSFKGQKDKDFVITYYKGDDHATTYMKETKLPVRTNPNGTDLVINDNALLASGAYEKQNFTVDFDNRLVYMPGPIQSGTGVARLNIKNFDTNAMNYDYAGTLLFMAPVQATTYGITQDASNIGDAQDLRTRYRALQIRDLTTFDVKLVIGQNGIYEGQATMTGSGSSTRIPANVKIMTLRNSMANNQVFFAFIPGQVRAYDLSGNVVLDLTKDIGFSANSFLVKMQQTAGQVVALLVNPDSATQPVKKITLTDTYQVIVEDYKLNGFEPLVGTGGGITAAAYDSSQNALVVWFYRSLGGEAVALYSMTTETFRWTTWSNRSDLQIADRFHNPRGMHLSRINRGLHLVWVSDKGVHGVDLRTGTYTSLNSTTRPRVAEYQFWDEKTGTLINTSQYQGGWEAPVGTEAIWRYSINFPDSTFTATFALGEILNGDMPHIKPYNSSMIVERNGLRLAPPRIYYAVNETSFYMGEDKTDVANLYIIDDTGQTTNVILAADGDYEGVDEVLAANRGERYLYWKDFIVFRDADAETRKYAITIAGSGDFSINDSTGVLTVNAMSASDTIRTLHWRNDGIMIPQTWSFKAHTSGTYRIKTTSKKGSSWVTLNGRRLVEDVDYSIIPVVEGAWDVDAFETFGWDDLTEVDITIHNMLKGHDNDLIVVTTFEGPQNTPAIDWQHASLTPDIVRFRYNPEPADGDRPYLKEAGAWATESHDLKREGGSTTNEVLVGTGTFNIKINALSVPTQMLAPDAVTVPDAKQNVPGVVWLGAERIEYFKRQNIGNGIITLDQVRRGTKGTPKLDHPLGTPVRVEHPMRKVPAAPLGDIQNIPVPSIVDRPYAPYTPPQFEGWYLKIRFYCTDRGRDAGWYAWNWNWNPYQANPPYGRSPDYIGWGYNWYENGSPNSPSCVSDNLCGQPLVTLDDSEPVPSGMGGNYQDPYPGQRYNPYDYTYTFWYDYPGGAHHLQQQFGAFNWGSIGKDGSPFKIMYRWWNTDWITAYTGYAIGLWPQYINWDILPAQATVGDIEESLDRNSIHGMPDGYGIFG